MFGWKSGKRTEQVVAAKSVKEGAKSKDAKSKSSLSEQVVQTQAAAFEYYAPYAATVSVAGSFNDWNKESHELRREGNGRWRLTMDLPLGRHEYRYVVDGQWASDQRPVEAAPNPYGSFNNVIRVG